MNLNHVANAKASMKKVHKLVQDATKFSPAERRKLQTDQRFEEESYYRITIRPRSTFSEFKAEPISGNGMLQQLNGRLENKRWSTYAWLVHKNGAHVEGKTLVANTKQVSQLFRALNRSIIRVSGDNYKLSSK